MDSTFLQTAVNICLAGFCLVSFLKLLAQFGLPNHPAKYLCYISSLCAVAYFVNMLLAQWSHLSPFMLLNLSSLFMVTLGFSLLIQLVTLNGNFGLVQQKVFSRLPLLAGLLFAATAPTLAWSLFPFLVLSGALYLTFAVGKARHQTRLYVKMSLFLLALMFGSHLPEGVGRTVLQGLLTFGFLFYFFIFESTFGVMALADQFLAKEST